MSFPHPAAFFLTSLALLAPASAQVRPGPTETEALAPNPKVLGVEVTYLANAGFHIQSGRYHVLIDAFLREPYQNNAALPPEVYRDLVQAKPPYDQLTLVFVSHDHADHVQYRGLEKYLENNIRACLMSSPQVVGSLKGNAKDYEAIQRRVRAIRVRPGTPEILMQEEMNVSFIDMRHVGKDIEDVQNLAHVISMGGMKLLHLGDAEPNVEAFASYNLQQYELDIAFIPAWYFGTERGRRVLAEHLPARVRIAYHVPPNDFETFDALLKEQYPDVIHFRDSLETRRFLPSGVEPARSQGADAKAQTPERD